MPRALGKWPSRDGGIEYLRRYAERTGVVVRTGTEVQRIDREPQRGTS
jgi:phytoene dehydrogenase-like protein